MSDVRKMLNKVPEVTLYFWVIKVLCTRVGETASDYLTDNVGLGLTRVTFITGALLIAVLIAQFRARRYMAPVYWLAVVLISVVGTQITDNLTDLHGVALETTTTVFAIALAVTFLVWWLSERTLSIHTIFTTRREGFYWLAVLFTFALGTAAGDLLSERLSLGYALAVGIFAAAIAVVAVAHYRFALNAVAAFWAAYILTRPLGASIGDYLSQPRSAGGLGLGTTVTTFLFLGTILVVVAFLTLTRRDVTEAAELGDPPITRILVVVHGSSAVNGILDAVRGRHARGPAQFHLLVSDVQAKEVLASTLRLLPEIDIEGSVSTRENPMDAVEESLHDGRFDEVIVGTEQHRLSHWLHVDLSHRLGHVGVPVTTVVG